MKKIFCFGEFMLRMSPSLNKKWIHDANMPVYFGGAELNVATALSNWNVPSKYFTALPDNYLSKEICETLAEKNIDISSIVFAHSLISPAVLKQSAAILNRLHASSSFPLS